jgi:uncharacterized protein (DUF2132 family)
MIDRKYNYSIFLFLLFLTMQRQPKNQLHGKTLEMIMNELVAHYGWPELGYRIRVNCFLSDPSIQSSLKFLRKTPWARNKVEDLYLEMISGRDK